MPERAPGWIWVQAVSVGELLLADGILGRLRDAGYAVHVTTGTRAGLDLLGRRLPGWDQGTGRVTGGPFPLDDPRGLAPFLRRPPAPSSAWKRRSGPACCASSRPGASPRPSSTAA